MLRCLLDGSVISVWQGAAGRLDSLLVQHGLNISLVLIGSSEVMLLNLLTPYGGRHHVPS